MQAGQGLKDVIWDPITSYVRLDWGVPTTHLCLRLRGGARTRQTAPRARPPLPNRQAEAAPDQHAEAAPNQQAEAAPDQYAGAAPNQQAEAAHAALRPRLPARRQMSLAVETERSTPSPTRNDIYHHNSALEAFLDECDHIQQRRAGGFISPHRTPLEVPLKHMMLCKFFHDYEIPSKYHKRTVLHLKRQLAAQEKVSSKRKKGVFVSSL